MNDNLDTNDEIDVQREKLFEESKKQQKIIIFVLAIIVSFACAPVHSFAITILIIAAWIVYLFFKFLFKMLKKLFNAIFKENNSEIIMQKVADENAIEMSQQIEEIKQKQFYKKITTFIKSLPKDNYHILGYVTFFYLSGLTLLTWYHGAEGYGVYQILRWLVTVFSVWTAVNIYKESPKSRWLLVFCAIAILFNPIFKITFEEETWIFIDVLTILLFICFAYKNRIKTILKTNNDNELK